MAYQSTTSTHSDSQLRHQSRSEVKDIIIFFWKLRYWILAFVLISLAVATVYIRFQTPLYQRHARILLTSSSRTNSEMSALTDFAGTKSNSNIANEVFILQSPRLMTQVVNDLGLHTRYFSKFVPHTPNPKAFIRRHFSIKTYEYYKDSPISMEIFKDPLYPAQSLPTSLRFDIITASDGFYFQKPTTPIECQADTVALHHYGDTISFRGYSMLLNVKVPSQLRKNTKFYVTWTNPEVAAVSYADRLSATIETESTSSGSSVTDVITLALTDSKPSRAEDILNALIYEYNQETLRYKNASVMNSLEFIDNRLEVVSKELANVEHNYLTYQSSRSLVDIQAQSQMAITSNMDYEKQLSEIRLQSSILEMIKDGMSNMKNGEYNVIPSDIGLSDASLGSVITSYNMLVSDRNRLISNSSENNPRVRTLTQQLEDARNSILLSIDNLEKVYIIRENELLGILKKSQSKMSVIPGQQFDLSQIERKQQIIEPLYLLLQQKKEEAQISMYSMTESARIIEDARGSSQPISPASSSIYLFALLIGLLIPPGFVFLTGLFSTTVVSRDDIKRVLDEPVIATIPQTKYTSVDWGLSSHDMKSESFRMLRSSLLFLSGKVIQVTSSIRGEGKSFVATNLAVSIALTGKRVALLGMDLRKPVFSSRFGSKADMADSVMGFLTGKCDDPSLILQPWEKNPNLSIAFTGGIPPHPTELLDTERLGTLIEWVKERFDYVIIDSAPMLPVPDSILINRYVDNTLYVIRSEYTSLKILPEIKLLFEQSEIRSPKIVLNHVNLSSKVFKYGYGYSSYGYGESKYGYCYGYDYVSEDKKKR